MNAKQLHLEQYHQSEQRNHLSDLICVSTISKANGSHTIAMATTAVIKANAHIAAIRALVVLRVTTAAIERYEGFRNLVGSEHRL